MANTVNIPGMGEVSLDAPEAQPQAPLVDINRDKEYLMSLPNENIQRLVQGNFISPEALQELQAAKMAQFQGPITDAGQALGNFATGMLPQPLSFAPQGQVQAPAQPLPEAVKQEAKTQAAAELAAQQGAEEAAQHAEDHRAMRTVAAQEKAAARGAEIEDQVRKDFEPTKTDPNKMSIGQLIFASLGAFAQGLSGGKSNIYFDIMDKQIEREAKEKKYNDEQKNALRKLAIEEAMMKVRQMDAASDSQLKKAQMAKIYAELGSALGQVQQAQDFQNRVRSGQGFGATELASMDPEMSNRMVQVKPGVYMPSASKDPKELRISLNTFDNAVRDAKELRALAQQFGNNSFAKIVDRQAKGRSDALLQGLVGALRLPYFGPGVLTDTEQALARKMIGNPTDVFSLASANEARINTIIQKLNYAKKTALRNEGVNVPLSANEKKMAAYRAHGVKLKDPELINAMIQKGDWNPDEE